MLPLPTIFLCVSGKKRSMAAKWVPVIMTRNQNTHLHPILSVMLPPITGPRLGAISVLRIKKLSKLCGMEAEIGRGWW
jgi:hypothetical protein